jgi:lipoprotein-releasing system permease protein
LKAMYYEWLVGLRYLRSRRKPVFINVTTLFSVAGILIGVMALIVVLGVMTGFEEDLRDKILGARAHVTVLQHGNKGMEDWKKVLEAAKPLAHVEEAAPFVDTQVFLSAHDRTVGVLLRGIHVERAGVVTAIEKNLVRGRLAHLSKPPAPKRLQPGEQPPSEGVILGIELARNIAVDVGSTLTVVSPGGRATAVGYIPRMKNLQVVGIFDSGYYEYDNGVALVSLKSAQSLLGLGSRVSGVEIRLDDIFAAEAVASKLQEALGFPYWVVDWKARNKSLFSALKVEKNVMFVILTMIMLVAGFSIASSLVMVVMEKRKDIAILKAMGATQGSLVAIFTLQGFIIGAAGVLLGFLGGLGLAHYLNEIEGVLELLFNIEIFPKNVYYLDSLPVHVRWFDVAVILTTALVVSVIAALYPAWRASRLDPVEAIRYE